MAQVSLHSAALGPQMYPPCRQKGDVKLQRLAAWRFCRCLCPAAKEQFLTVRNIDGEDARGDMQHLNKCDGLRKARM